MRSSMWPRLLALALLAALLLPASARAHGDNTGPVQTYTQAVGPYELAVTLELPASTPGTVFIDVLPQVPVDGATMQFRAAPRGQGFDRAQAVELEGLAGPPTTYLTDLPVDRDGDWELEVRIDGPSGAGVATIPFALTTAPLPATTLALSGAVGLLVLLMVSNIATAAVAQRRGRPAPRWWSTLVGQGMFACLIVVAVLGVQQMAESWRAASAPPASGGRPHANMALGVSPAAPEAGQPATLTLDLTDGATGQPVEDLIPHHEALMHLVIIDQSGGFFAHVHPPRTGPGRYEIGLTPDRPGRYTAYAEIVRQDSGSQLLAREFQVYGEPGAADDPAPGLGSRQVGDLQVDVAASSDSIRAGRQTTLTFSFQSGGRPVQDVEPWLGMAGHLVARSDDGVTYSHVHAAEPMAPTGIAGSGTRYGPDIRFAYTFPQPGRYQLWAQFRHAGQIVTVPLTLDVTA